MLDPIQLRRFPRPAHSMNFEACKVAPRKPNPLADDLHAIPGKPRGIETPLCEMEARPRPPRANFRPRTGHPAGEVLEMANRISEITAISRSSGFQNPNQCAVGRWVRFQDLLTPGQIRHPRLVELEDCLRGFPTYPLGLGIAQRVQIEFAALRMTMAAGQQEIVDSGKFRQPRTGKILTMSADGTIGTNTRNGILEKDPALNLQPIVHKHLRHLYGLASHRGLSILAAT